MKRSILLLIAAVAGTATLFQCSQLPLMAGNSSSETTNGMVVGTVRSESGQPAEKTIVKLLPADYNPVADNALFDSLCKTDTTDLLGSFTFKNVPPGNYSIESVRWPEGKRALVQVSAHARQTDTAPLGILRAPGVLKIAIPDSADLMNGYFFLPGTTISSMLPGRNGYEVIDSIPAGVIPSIRYSTLNSSVSSVIRYAVPVYSGDTTIVEMPEWKYSKRLFLNTGSSGADVAGDVFDFPVLIRLTSSNFDFSKARSGGEDVRFTKSNSSPLPLEVELWDLANSAAAIWVKVDTIYGNNDMQSIIMYWGNPAARDASDGAAVFDTGGAAGFQGVWHMTGAGNDTAIDATANRYHGVPVNMTPLSAVTGMVGGAREFDGTTTYVTMPGTAGGMLNFPEDGFYAVSAWVYVDTVTHAFNHYIIASKGNMQYSLELMDSSAAEASGDNGWEFCETQNMAGWDVSVASMTTKAWAHIVGMRIGTKQYLYVNGVCVDSVIRSVPSNNSPRDETNDLVLGKMNPDFSYFFDGIIDEVRISRGALSADRITLCYMNQKSPGVLVQF